MKVDLLVPGTKVNKAAIPFTRCCLFLNPGRVHRLLSAQNKKNKAAKCRG